MIYFDSAATAMRRPEAVVRAVAEAMTTFGNAGRGGHEASMEASRVIFDTRKRLADFFHAEDPRRIVFTMNATESLNIAIKGSLGPKDHVITTAWEHNSVLRPLYEMEEQGTEVTVLSADSQGRICEADFERFIRENTKAILCTHASNVTGNLMDLERIGRICEKHHLLFIVDASQTAGVFPIDVQRQKIDVLCFTGHKGLLGPQGTGGLYVREGIMLRPLLSGGSGIHSYDRKHPMQMPTALEAGTLNGHGLAGLKAAVEYLQEVGLENIRRREQELMWEFYEAVSQIPGVTIYGDFTCSEVKKSEPENFLEHPSGRKERSPIVTLNVRAYDSSEVSDALFWNYGISVRSGAHCAPLMHQALGTAERGAVRFSFSYYNTKEEIRAAVAALTEIAREEE